MLVHFSVGSNPTLLSSQTPLSPEETSPLWDHCRGPALTLHLLGLFGTPFSRSVGTRPQDAEWRAVSQSIHHTRKPSQSNNPTQETFDPWRQLNTGGEGFPTVALTLGMRPNHDNSALHQTTPTTQVHAFLLYNPLIINLRLPGRLWATEPSNPTMDWIQL